jgi:hypothetical protein
MNVTRRQKSPLARHNPARYAISIAFMLALFGASTPAQSSAQLDRENRELQAAFNLMVRQLSSRDSTIQELQSYIAQLESEAGMTRTLGCSVDDAKKLIVAETFIYDREQVFLAWLVDNVSGCKLFELEDLDSVANQYKLTQSLAVILREMVSREETIAENTVSGVPLIVR